MPSDAGRRQGVPHLQRVCPWCSVGEIEAITSVQPDEADSTEHQHTD
jgi:hypothetical protein